MFVSSTSIDKAKVYVASIGTGCLAVVVVWCGFCFIFFVVCLVYLFLVCYFCSAVQHVLWWRSHSVSCHQAHLLLAQSLDQTGKGRTKLKRSVKLCMGWHRTGHDMTPRRGIFFWKVSSLLYEGFGFTTAGKCRCICSWGRSLMASMNYAQKCLSDINVFSICQFASKKRWEGAGEGRATFQEWVPEYKAAKFSHWCP